MTKNCQNWPKMTKNENFESRDEKIKVVEEVSGVISIYITYTFGRKKFRPPLPQGRSESKILGGTKFSKMSIFRGYFEKLLNFKVQLKSI